MASQRAEPEDDRVLIEVDPLAAILEARGQNRIEVAAGQFERQHDEHCASERNEQAHQTLAAIFALQQLVSDEFHEPTQQAAAELDQKSLNCARAESSFAIFHRQHLGVFGQQLIVPIEGRESPGQWQSNRLANEARISLATGEHLAALNYEKILHQIAGRCLGITEGIHPQVGEQEEARTIGESSMFLVDHIEFGAVGAQLAR